MYKTKRTASSEFGTYHLSALIQVVSQDEPSDRKPDPWPLWMAGHAQLKFVMTECSKTQIRLTGLKDALLLHSDRCGIFSSPERKAHKVSL